MRSMKKSEARFEMWEVGYGGFEIADYGFWDLEFGLSEWLLALGFIDRWREQLRCCYFRCQCLHTQVFGGR